MGVAKAWLWLAVPFLAGACNPIPPKPVYSAEVEDETLKADLTGHLSFETLENVNTWDLSAAAPQSFPGMRELIMLTNPDRDGNLIGVQNQMMKEQHTYFRLAKGRRTDLETRPGDALWGINFEVHPVSEAGALRLDGSLAAYIVDAKGIQFPGYYVQGGAIELRELPSGKVRRIPGTYLDFPIAFTADGKELWVTRSTESAGEPKPEVGKLNLETGVYRKVADGLYALPSRNPNRVVLALSPNMDEAVWWDVKSGKTIGEPIRKYVIGAIDDRRVLILDDPSPGSKHVLEQHGKGPRNTQRLKVYDPTSGKVATLGGPIGSHARIAFAPARRP